MTIMRRLLFTALLVCPGFVNTSVCWSEGQAPTELIKWDKIEQGYSIGRYTIPEVSAVMKSEVLLLRFDPRYFYFQVARSAELGALGSDLKTLTKRLAGVAGINANFFGQDRQPLGLIVDRGKQLQKVHIGGHVLTGIFYTIRGQAKIVHREDFKESNAEVALQSGPRLIVDGHAAKLNSQMLSSRRSGIAVTKDNQVIVFATLLRFPGATLEQIQRMLLTPELAVTDALNFDGGGSSQLYISGSKSNQSETFISGGDLVPVGLIAKRKELKDR